MNRQIVQQLVKSFREKFGSEPLLSRAPGRVNIIGEHTDYNDGFVLPAAIDKAIYVAVSKRDDEQICFISLDFQDSYETTVHSFQPVEKQWVNYILGVAAQMQKAGKQLGGFNMMIAGDVPLGAGLSSSAAVECSVAVALNELFQFGIERKALTFMAQKAEHEFAGVQCGIMDQFASMFGKKDHVIKLDCRSLEYKYEPLRLGDYKIVLLNTNVKHSLASSEYNTRRKECAQGVELLQKNGININSLRDADMQMLNTYVKPVDEVIYRRCKYVVEENQRLLATCRALESGDLQMAGQLMYASHEGLKNEYEVSCPELDFLVNAVKENPSVAGARMMGGGFGGCTINLVKEVAIAALVHDLSKAYKEAMNLELTTYVAETADGAGLLDYESL